MRSALSKMATVLPIILMSVLILTAPAQAQTCNQASIAAVIDSNSAELRKLNASHQPALQAKIKRLAEQNGWPDSEINAKAAELLQDQESSTFDEQVGQLLSEMDLLGDQNDGDPASCATRLSRLKTVSAQLIELTTAKAAHASARLDAALASSRRRTAAQPAPHPAPKTESKAPPAPAEKPESVARHAVPEKRATKAPASKAWDTDTKHQDQPDDVAGLTQPPPALRDLPPHQPQADEFEYTVEEIRAAGRGFFGSISANLASVIEYAFQTYGRPNGYILGSEGGGAFLAGLRYGKGRLVSKIAGEHEVYWQGPSFGYDLGLEGSRVMFLVYNMTEPGELFARFAGVDGSAYLVGGAGITFLKKGRLVLAPIRTGLGLRVGANLGYLKFTPQPSLNPF